MSVDAPTALADWQALHDTYARLEPALRGEGAYLVDTTFDLTTDDGVDRLRRLAGFLDDGFDDAVAQIRGLMDRYESEDGLGVQRAMFEAIGDDEVSRRRDELGAPQDLFETLIEGLIAGKNTYTDIIQHHLDDARHMMDVFGLESASSQSHVASMVLPKLERLLLAVPGHPDVLAAIEQVSGMSAAGAQAAEGEIAARRWPGGDDTVEGEPAEPLVAAAVEMYRAFLGREDPSADHVVHLAAATGTWWVLERDREDRPLQYGLTFRMAVSTAASRDAGRVSIDQVVLAARESASPERSLPFVKVWGVADASPMLLEHLPSEGRLD